MSPQLEKWRNPRRWASLLFFLLVMWMLAALANNIWQWLENEQRVPLRAVLVSGERTFVTDADVEKVVRSSFKGSFIALNVDNVHGQIEKMPWVQRASVRKEWPDTLRVYLIEQKAVAKWNDDMLLNQYGKSFQAKVPEELQHLPVLFGPGGSERTALEGYKAMQSLLANTDLEIAELSLSERYAWHIRLKNDVNLNLGRTEFMNRLQRFVDIYPLLLRNEKAVSYVDLRYDTGLAVGWKESSPTKEQQLNG